ncbi:threonine aldolase [Arachidicoccus ginsenosidimutans]|uniref:threonine aldolase family protein n=1 Tax=Arachidicoccus sp. BS20 TaxID=1850526 RepID=UPI0007F0EE55|nr:aminotransferase class I/II-fold pyridoxal phosphate-dependent enzyme [Arachidicoccus sp. BS20]ANI90444.1 threonine aldolase [Arachidicoccus sp. BS20]
MYSFKNDYSEGAHPNILNKLIETNLVQQAGYGEDDYSTEAKNILKQKLNNDDAKIYFVSGGTQTNFIVIAALLRPHEAVISADTGHIFTNEAGAIESSGHKIIPIPTKDGKIKTEEIANILKEYNSPNTVKPKLVYISNATELGTIYSKNELSALFEFCKSNNLYLFMDGARLGNALTAYDNDLTFSDIAALTNVFYIGGTKNGALLGEAIVFNTSELATDFDYMVKQKGALLSKGRVLGIQFLELFKDDLYFSLAKRANDLCMKIINAAKEQGYSFLAETSTNQAFPILPNKLIEKLMQRYSFYIWEEIDTNFSAVRLITSWATDEDKVDEFIRDLKSLSL